MVRTLFAMCAGMLGVVANAQIARAQCEPEWLAMDTGMNSLGLVHALATLPDEMGDLVAGGEFVTAGGIDAKFIARWNSASQQWSALGTGMNSWVFALTTLPGNGDIVAGGLFTTAGGVSAKYVARWNPGLQQWSALGAGMNGGVHALITLTGGTGEEDVVAGGVFTSAGGVSANRIALWSPATGQWSALGAGMSGGVFALATLPTGDIYAGGDFSAAGGVSVNRIARWNTATKQWSVLGAGVSGNVYALTTLRNGDLIAGGLFGTAGGVPVNRIARWEVAAEEWRALGTGMGNFGAGVYALATMPGSEGELIAGGAFVTAGGVPATHIARWDPAAQEWWALGQGVDSDVQALAVLPNGDLIAGGSFSAAGGVTSWHVARWTCTPLRPCQADCDGNGSHTIDDFICFQTFFALGDLEADCDASGFLNIDDFICFQTLFAIGC